MSLLSHWLTSAESLIARFSHTLKMNTRLFCSFVIKPCFRLSLQRKAPAMKNILKRGHPFRSVVGVEMSNNNVSADILCKIIIQS